MKKLYEFKDKLGDKEITFVLKKPTRSDMDEVQIFGAAMLSKLMNMGVQTRAAVDKYYADNTDGAMTKEDEKEYFNLRKDLVTKEEELIKSSTNEKKRLDLYVEVVDIQEKIRNFTTRYSEIYDNTAEIMTRDKTIDFCFLNYSYNGEDQLFPCDEEDFGKRVVVQYEKFEEYQDGDDGLFWSANFDKLIFLFTLWRLGAAETHEEFDGFFQTHFGEPDKGAAEEEEKELERVEKLEEESDKKELEAKDV